MANSWGYQTPRWQNDQAERVRLGFQCPECYGVRIEFMPRLPHDPVKAQCHECGCQWRTS